MRRAGAARPNLHLGGHRGPRGYRGTLENTELITSEHGTMFQVGGAVCEDQEGTCPTFLLDGLSPLL